MPVYSNSRINTFEHCPLQYKFKYIDKVDVERVRNIYAFLGSRVHEALEKLHEDIRNGKMSSLDYILSYFRSVWKESWSDDIVLPDNGYSPEHYRKVGHDCIENYYEEHEPFDCTRTVGTELHLYPTVSAGDRKYKFQGFIDRLALTPDGVYEVHDYKTSKSLPTKERLENDRQLALYQLAVHQEYPQAEDVELVWHYLRFGKDIRVKKSQNELNRLQNELVDLIDRIEKAEEEDNFPTARDRGARCDWCDYRSICPEWSHLYETENLPKNEFLNEDGIDLVDELASVERKLDELEERKSEFSDKKRKLEDAILDYARRKELTSVYGTEKRASIDSEERIKFPRSGHENREELEDLIKEAGRWEDVSNLRVRTLERIFREKEWPQDLVDNLEDFKILEEVERVNLEDIESKK